MSPALSRAADGLIAEIMVFRETEDSARAPFAAFRARILHQLEAFSKSSQAQQVSEDELEAARFGLAALTDEMILGSDWSERDSWASEPVALQLFGTRRAGVEFYERLEALGAEQNAAREVLLLCMVLGFGGQFGVGDSDQQVVIGRAFETLRRSGHALDAAREPKLVPGGYDFDIDFDEDQGISLGLLLAILAGVFIGVFGIGWIWLYFAGMGIPVPPEF